MGHISNPDEFERAFSGATVHDFFNFLSVLVLLPIEIIFHPLEHMTESMKPSDVDDGEKWVDPLKRWVSPLVKRLLNANKDIIKDVAKGKYTCEQLYYCREEDAIDTVATNCTDLGLSPSSKSLIKIGGVLLNPFDDETETKITPAFYTEGATKADDMTSGSVCLFISVVGLCFCLYALVRTLQSLVMSSSVGFIKKATDINPYLAILVGVGVTILVQSSSITTSVLTPLVGMDLITLEQMLPLTLGANIGTTATALLASMVSDKPESVQIALCHLFFNIFGIMIWFPIPFMRQIPLNAAKQMGFLTRNFKGFPAVYILFAFVVMPLILLGTSTLFEEGGAYVVIGSFIVIILFVTLVRTIYFFRMQDGYVKFIAMLDDFQEGMEFKRDLRKKVKALEENVEALMSNKKDGDSV